MSLPPDPLPISSIDPLAEPGEWLVTTASGSRHLIDTSDEDRGPRVQRLPSTDDPATPQGRFLAADLRRDAEWLPLLAVGWLDGRTGEKGTGTVHVGRDMVMVLDVRGDGIETLRRTTPVTKIERVVDRPSARLAAVMTDATRCYVEGCECENEILVHLRDDPWGGADLCMEHARLAAEQSRSLIARCDCPFCAQARATLWGA